MISDGEAMQRCNEIGRWRKPMDLPEATYRGGRCDGNRRIHFRKTIQGRDVNFTRFGTHSRQRLGLGLFQRPLTPGKFEHRSANRVTFRISSGDGSRLLRRPGLLTATVWLRLSLLAGRVFLWSAAALFTTTGLARAATRHFSRPSAEAEMLDRAVRTTANEMGNAGQQCRSCCRPHDQNCGYILKSAHVSPITTTALHRIL